MRAPGGFALIIIATLAVGLCTALVALPRKSLHRSGAWALVASSLSTVLCVLATHPMSFILAWSFSVASLFAPGRDFFSAHARRAVVALVVSAIAPVAVAFVLIASHVLTHTSALSVFSPPVSSSTQHVIAALLFVSALGRAGAFPFHSWLPALAEHGPAGPVITALSAPLGIFALIHWLPILCPVAIPWVVPLALCLGTTGALYGGLVILAQRDLRRGVGFIAIAQTGIAFAGLGTGAATAIAGSMLYSAGTSLSTVGLLTVSNVIAARTETTALSHLGGIAATCPRLSVMFFLLGAMSIGIPCSMAFTGEWLIIRGLLESHPAIVAVLLIATALLSAGFFAMFTRAFLGPAPHDPSGDLREVPELLPRERIALIAIITLGAISGLASGTLLKTLTPDSTRLSSLSLHASTHSPSKPIPFSSHRIRER